MMRTLPSWWAIVGLFLVPPLGAYGAGESSVASLCSNFNQTWLSVNGEYIFINQQNCSVTATNPVETWKSHGEVVGDELHMFNITGTLARNSIHWNDATNTIWTRVTAPPLDEGLTKLRQMLQTAVQIEQSVIQPYLSALYSIEAGTNQNAASVLHGVSIEEMLHMTSAANVLNAIGGHPTLNTKSFVPVYPMKLPFINLSVSLAPFSQDQTFLFKRIEEAPWGLDNPGIHTVGVWYFEISILLDLLVWKYGEKAVYVGDPELQVNASSSRGTVQGIYNHAHAQKILADILTEGEGVKSSLNNTSPFNGKQEHSHYHRFNEIAHNRYYQPSDNKTQHSREIPTGAIMGVNWTAVYDFAPNPRAADYSSYPDIHQKMLQFNSCYTQLLAGLHDVFNGSPTFFMPQIHDMMILATLAKELITVPAPGRPGKTVGPPWEWVDISRSDVPSCPSNYVQTVHVVI